MIVYTVIYYITIIGAHSAIVIVHLATLAVVRYGAIV